MADDTNELVRQTQAPADAGRKNPHSIALDGPGPFELPPCGKKAWILLREPGQFVLELETAELEQRVWVPISTSALPALRSLIDRLGHILKEGIPGTEKL